MGYEIRIGAPSKRELAGVRRAISATGLQPGKPFDKRGNWVQPIYGRDAVERFVAWLDGRGRA
jgi:hypothetical protein